jgi:hypothetical protein
LFQSGQPSGKVLSSRSGILKSRFKRSKLPKGMKVKAQLLERPLPEDEPLQTMVPILYDPNVWKLREKRFEFLDPLPEPPTYADEETNLKDKTVQDNLCRRNPRRKDRPNDKLVQQQLGCASDDEFSANFASPVPSNSDNSDSDDSSTRRATAWTIFPKPNFTLTLTLTLFVILAQCQIG